jgi:hypothetical protein
MNAQRAGANGSMLRIATVVILLGGALSMAPATAQSPPRPPGDVPNGFPAQPPPVTYPGQPQYSAPAPNSPGQTRGPAPSTRSQSAIQAQPLAPPPGGTAAPPAAGQRTAPPSAASVQRGRNPPPGPADASAPPVLPPPPVDTTPQPEELPSQKIANARAVFSGLDKITGRIISFDAAIGETVQFGALRVTARVCYTRPPTEATNTDAFVEVDEVTLQGEIKRIFTGWMFAASPGLHAVEHPIYDVWLADCASPEPTRVAQPAPPPTTAPAPAVVPPPARTRQAPRQQTVPPASAVSPTPQPR